MLLSCRSCFLSLELGRSDMANPGTNEKKYPHIVEFAVGEKGVDFELGRRIIDFHKSRRIMLRHGHIILKAGKIIAGVFQTWRRLMPSSNSLAAKLRDQFAEPSEARRIAVNIAKLPLTFAVPPAIDALGRF